MRIVSLCPSLTELVFALGLGDRLVARTGVCVHPGEGVGRGLPGYDFGQGLGAGVSHDG